MGGGFRWRRPRCQGGCGSPPDLSWLFTQGTPVEWKERVASGFMEWLRIPGFRDMKNAFKWIENLKSWKKSKSRHAKLLFLHRFCSRNRQQSASGCREGEQIAGVPGRVSGQNARARLAKASSNRGGNQFEQDLNGWNKKSHVANCCKKSIFKAKVWKIMQRSVKQIWFFAKM